MVRDTQSIHEKNPEKNTYAYMQVSITPKNQDDAGDDISLARL
jgi:hypothetical protein